MPTYSYLCRECSEHFDLRRPMSAATDPAPCPEGHEDTVKLLAAVSLAGGRPAGGQPEPSAGGGCCGGACGCAR